MTMPREVDLMKMFDALQSVRGANIQTSEPGHSLVIPFATYSPWLLDEGFHAVWNKVKNHTLLDIYRLYELWDLVRQLRHVPGDVLEVGVWRGGSSGVMGTAMKTFAHGARIFVADTFSGVVKAGERDPAYRGGEHEASVVIASELMQRLELDNSEFLVGVFPEDTAESIEDRTFRLCHIDVDTYQSAKDTFEWVWPRMSSGGAVVLDDYGFLNCDGVRGFVHSADIRDGIRLYNLNGHALVLKR